MWYPGYFYSRAGASNWRNGPLQFESCHAEGLREPCPASSALRGGDLGIMVVDGEGFRTVWQRILRRDVALKLKTRWALASSGGGQELEVGGISNLLSHSMDEVTIKTGEISNDKFANFWNYSGNLQSVSGRLNSILSLMRKMNWETQCRRVFQLVEFKGNSVPYLLGTGQTN